MNFFSHLDKHPGWSESIYNLVEPKMTGTYNLKTRYVSKFDTFNKEFYQNTKSTIPRTMGYTHVPLNSPQEYLKKHSRESRTEANKSVNCLCRMRNSKEKSEVKSKESPAAVPENTQRDFVTENFLEAAKRPSTTPAKRIVDSRKGDSHDLESSGLVPKYIFKENYGKTPTYIKKIQKSLFNSREEFEKFITSNDNSVAPRLLSVTEKENILQGLVKNLKGLLKLYLTLPMRVDTPRSIARRLEIESRLDDIQQQIDIIQRHKEIFVGKE